MALTVNERGYVIDTNTGKGVGGFGRYDSSKGSVEDFLAPAQQFHESVIDKRESSQAPQQQMPQFQMPQIQDNSAQIAQMFEQQKADAIAQLKQAIAQNKSQQQSVIQKAPAQYQPLRNQVSANRYQNLNSLREMMANDGQQGGVNRTEATRVNTAAESDMNTLSAQQQQIIDDANRAITDLEASGSFQEAQIVAQNAAQRIQALTAESNRVEQASYQRLRDAIEAARYEREFEYGASQDSIRNSQWDKTFDYNAKQDTLANNLARQKALSGGVNNSTDPNQAFSEAIQSLGTLKASGKSQEEILSTILQKSTELSDSGVDVMKLYEWVKKNLTDGGPTLPGSLNWYGQQYGM